MLQNLTNTSVAFIDHNEELNSYTGAGDVHDYAESTDIINGNLDVQLVGDKIMQLKTGKRRDLISWVQNI